MASPPTPIAKQVAGGLASWASSARVRRSMESNRGRDTRLELALRRRLYRDGYRYWTHRRPEQSLRCVADVVFPRLKLAVFIDGCFWHWCPTHGTMPVLNRDWWRAKLEGNKARDHKNDLALRAAGWTVLRLWEHEPLEDMRASVARAIESLRSVR